MSKTPGIRGFEVRCLLCGKAGMVHVDLDSVTLFKCRYCGETWTIEDVRKQTKAWEPIIAWVESAPFLED